MHDLGSETGGLSCHRIMRYKEACAAIGEAGGYSLARSAGIERYIGSTSFENAEQRNVQIERAGKPETDEVAALDAARRQCRCNEIGSPIEFAVAQRFCTANERESGFFRKLPRAGAKDIDQRLIAKKIRPRMADQRRRFRRTQSRVHVMSPQFFPDSLEGEQDTPIVK